MEINIKSNILTQILATIVLGAFTTRPFEQLKEQLMKQDQNQWDIENGVEKEQQNKMIQSKQNDEVQDEGLSSVEMLLGKPHETTQGASKQAVDSQQQVNNQIKIVTQQQKAVVIQQLTIQQEQTKELAILAYSNQILIQKMPHRQVQNRHEVVVQNRHEVVVQNRNEVFVQNRHEVVVQNKNQFVIQKLKQALDHIQISEPYMIQDSSFSKNIHELKQPPYLSNKKNYTEQSSQKQKSNLKDSRESKDKGKKLSSEQQSFNLDMTQKTRKSNNMANTYGRADSLIYSDATLMYSNATGFGKQLSQNSNRKQTRKESGAKQQLKKIDDNDSNGQISGRMQRAQSRQINRIRTESQNKTDLEINLRTQQEERIQNVFQTQIYDKKRISRIKELKESKKKKLQKQLRKVNEELLELARKQSQGKSNPKSNNYESRVKISDNIEAKVKAQRLIKNLRYQKKSRHDAHLDELQVLDKNINNYMQQIVKERYKNEDRIKQKKKLQIIERMKKQQLRKIEQQKMKEKNLQFLHQMKNSGSKNNLVAVKTPQHKKVQEIESYVKQKYQENQQALVKERSHTKKSESIMDESEMTPQLSRKKALMKRLRNLSIKKQAKPDLYQHMLG